MELTDEQQKELFLKEKEMYPEESEKLVYAIKHRRPLYYKEKRKFIEIPFNDALSILECKKYKDKAWDIDIRMHAGKLRMIISIIDYKAMAYLAEHTPGINYISTALVLEDFGKKWKTEK